MLKEQAKLFNRLAVLTDFIVVLGAFSLAYVIRHAAGGLTGFLDYAWLLIVIVPVWFYLISRYGLYASLRTRSLPQVLASLVKVHVMGGIVATSVIYFLEPTGYSRGLVTAFLVLSFFLLCAEKALLKGVLGFIRQRGYNVRNVLVVGMSEKALAFVQLIELHAGWGLRVVGFLQPNGDTQTATFAGYNVLGRMENLPEVCRFYAVDEVVFCVPPEELRGLDERVREMAEMGITVRMVLDFYESDEMRREVSMFHERLPMLTFYGKAFDASQLFLKRCLDIAGSLVGLALTILLFPFIALAIRLDSPGPLLFSQGRVGMNGRIFRCWKFRSMYVDAEERKKELMAQNEMKGAMFKMKDDPRITKVGRFLRKTSLDELPQFWNVFRGEMSLVGTRPPTPDEVMRYERWHRKRICIKPGITGLWQVSGRNQIQEFDEVVRLDLQYIDRWSIWLDLKLLCKTVWVVFARRGSC